MIGVLSGLLILSAGYVTNFHNWLVNNSNVDNNHNVTGYQVASGLRSIVHQEPLESNDYEGVSSKVDKFLNVGDSNLTEITQGRVSGITGDSKTHVNPLISNKTDSNIEKMASEKNSTENFDSGAVSMPLIVELDSELLVEFSESYSKSRMRNVLSRLLVVPDSLDVELVLKPIPIETRFRPYLYKRVLNEYQNPIRYPAQAFRYVDYIMNNYTKSIKEDGKMFTLVSIPLVKPSIASPIESYQAWVNEYSKEHDISPELVFAIMEVESAFNPKAVSSSNALGLMQVKAAAAGADVYHYVDGKKGNPSKQALLNAKENIRIGVAYLGLLKSVYFKNIKSAKKREMMMISAYNGGLSKALQIFNKSPEAAVKAVNSMSDRTVYRKLAYEHSSKETRDYIKKVQKAKIKYSRLLA